MMDGWDSEKKMEKPRRGRTLSLRHAWRGKKMRHREKATLVRQDP